MAWNQDFGAGANPGTNNSGWQTNFNGGWAAGDWTGNHNAKKLAEKIASGQHITQSEKDHAPAQIKPVLEVLDAVRPRPGNPGGGNVGGNSPLGGGNANVTVPVDVVRAAVKMVSGLPQFGINWEQVTSGLGTLWAGGPNRHVLASEAKKHEQGVIGGHNIVHDLGWSPMEVMEDIYGDAEFLTPTWFYSWGKQLADWQKTAESVNMPGPKDVLDAAPVSPSSGDPFWDAGQTVRDKATEVWNNANAGWNTMTQWANNAVPLSNSSPGPRNPYANSNAYPF